ncbi:hypothetical protein [Candidatus Midichloria mitochondrii]|nr:hypothetical protein [Candidatus Midichloria mitochondrii]
MQAQAFSDIVRSMRAESNNPQSEYNKNSTLKKKGKLDIGDC